MITLTTLIYKEKEYNIFVSLLKDLIKDNMTMDQVREYLLSLQLTQDEVDFIMKNYYAVLI
jgi:Trp operon repressor